MLTRILLLAAAAATFLAFGAAAQQKQQLVTGGRTKPMVPDGLPKECRTTPAANQSESMQGIDMPRTSQESQGMMADMTEAQSGYRQSMMKMRGPMQMGIMASDPDVGFICGMIPRHQGAVDMAEVVLKTGHNLEVKRFADQVIKEQGQQINWMKDWLKKYANNRDN